MTYSIFHSTRALQLFLEALVFVAIAMAWLRPGASRAAFADAERRFSRFAAKRNHAILAAALFPMLVRLMLLPVFPIPQPRVHDEFSYLLLGDTLAHGRVTNPPPPSWQHFETEYELVRPTYASQYQPAQGVVLALGQVVLKNAWWGVWLSVGCMCGALCWALGFIAPPRWALFGSILAALQFGIFGFWMNSYYGGAVAAAGGALIFGSLLRPGRLLSAFTGAAGLLIVLASRPAEATIWLFAAAFIAARRGIPKRSVLACAAVLTVGVGALAVYNTQITGKPWKSPYALYREDYGTPQSYWWQAPVLVEHFDHPELEANYQDQLNYWQRRYSIGSLWDSTWRRVRDFWRFFIGPFLTPAFLFAGLALRRRRLLPWLWVSGLFILDHATYHAWYPQQSASETVLIMLLVTEGWRHLRVWRRRRGFGLALSGNLTLGFASAMIFLIAGLAFRPVAANRHGGIARVWDTMDVEANAREVAIRRLETAPGKHLVFVRYGANHPWYDEWVFNGADIPGSRIVFARMCTPESDLRLARSMKDRDVWIASPEDGPLIARVTTEELLAASLSSQASP